MEDTEIIVDLGEKSDAEAVLVHWVYDDGASVRQGQVVAEAMVDKVSLSIEAPQTGYLHHVVGTNAVFHSKQAVGVVKDSPALSVAPEQIGAVDAAEGSLPGGFVPASPAVRRYAKEKGVDLAAVVQSTPNHRLTLVDIDAFIAQRHNTNEKPYTVFRRSLIQHLTDDGALPTTLQRRVASGNSTDSPPLARIAWAVSQVLPKHPQIHGWATAKSFTAAEEVVLGIAAQTSAGLIVPVLHDQPHLDAWVRALASLRDALRANAVDTLDFSRPSFVLSNLGALGIEYFTPRLMVPTVAILGIGAGDDSSFPVSLTFDHRAVDGAEAAQFLMSIDRILGGG